MTDDERLTRLEETVYFQDRLIEELNSRITEQTCTLERVQARVGHLEKELGDMRDLLEAAGFVREIPPHSVPERFLTE